MIQVSDDPHTFESNPTSRDRVALWVGVIAGLFFGGLLYREVRGDLSTVAAALVSLSAFVVIVASVYLYKNKTDYRVVISSDGVRQFRRRRKDLGWVLRSETPCSEWAEAKVSMYGGDGSFLTQHRLELVHNGYKGKRIKLASPPGGFAGDFMFGFPGFEYFTKLENTAVEINEILRGEVGHVE